MPRTLPLWYAVCMQLSRVTFESTPVFRCSSSTSGDLKCRQTIDACMDLELER